MANEAYALIGTSVLFNGSGDVLFAVNSLANSTARTSAQKDWGADPRPFMYHWSCEVQFQATPTQYATLDLYIAEAPEDDATQISGDQGTSDALLTDVDALKNMKYIGSVVSENATAAEKCVANGYFTSFARYWSVVAYNDSGATVDADVADFRFDVTPVSIQGQ